MGVSIGHAKQKFAAIIEDLHQQPPLLSQFAVWLDLKLSEYKLQGGMRLDSHEVVSHPDWMQGIKCRCLLNVSSKMQSLVQETEFGNTAWMFPLMSPEQEGTKHRFQDLFVDDQRKKRKFSETHERSMRMRPSCTSGLTESGVEKDSGTFEETDSVSPITDPNRQCSLRDDRNIFNSASSGFYTNSSSRIPNSSSGRSMLQSPSQSASTFLSNLVKSTSSDVEQSPQGFSAMTLPTKPPESFPEKEILQTSVSPEVDYMQDKSDEVLSDSGSEVGSDSNDIGAEEDDVVDMLEVDDEQMPKIVSVTTVRPNSSFPVPGGTRPTNKTRWKVHRKMHCPQKKTRVVRNYSRGFKLNVVAHSLKQGTKSAVMEFDIPKSNVQRWTTRVVKSCPYSGLTNCPDLLDNVIKAELDLATWLRDAFRHSGSVSVSQLKENAVPIFRSVYPEFNPEYVWLLHFLAKYKLVNCVDIPIDSEDCNQLSGDEGNDLY